MVLNRIIMDMLLERSPNSKNQSSNAGVESFTSSSGRDFMISLLTIRLDTDASRIFEIIVGLTRPILLKCRDECPHFPSDTLVYLVELWIATQFSRRTKQK